MVLSACCLGVALQIGRECWRSVACVLLVCCRGDYACSLCRGGEARGLVLSLPHVVLRCVAPGLVRCNVKRRQCGGAVLYRCYAVSNSVFY